MRRAAPAGVGGGRSALSGAMLCLYSCIPETDWQKVTL